MCEFDALIRRKHLSDLWTRYNFGIVAAAVHNCAPYGDEHRQPLTPMDFVPALKEELEGAGAAAVSTGKTDLQEMNAEQQKAFIDALFGAHHLAAK